MELNPYETLGIPRTATQAEIKRSFRKLARTYHPDFNPGDMGAERRFKQIQAAYDILGDPAKRRRYDRLGVSSFRRRGQSQEPPKSAREFVDEFMESFLRQDLPRRKRGEDLKYYLSIGLEEVVTGVYRSITVPRSVECAQCRGTGADSSDGKVTCPGCDGLGEVHPKRGLLKFKRPCPSCGGTGYKIVKACSRCAGKGRERLQDAIRVWIPPGVNTGQRLKVKDRGNGGYREGDPGDLYVIVHVREHDTFRRQGSELIADVPVSFYDATIGGTIEVPTLDGNARITLPTEVRSGKMFRLKGQGMPRLRGMGRGDLHIRLQVDLPARMTPDQKRIVEAHQGVSGKTSS